MKKSIYHRLCVWAVLIVFLLSGCSGVQKQSQSSTDLSYGDEENALKEQKESEEPANQSNEKGDKKMSLVNTYWVSLDGNDKNPGTQEQPFATLQRAANKARAGDTVKVMPGVYNEAVVVKNFGVESAPIVFESVERFGAVLTKPDAVNLFRGSTSAYSKYVTLRGFWFKDTLLDPRGPYYDAAVLPSKGWRIEDCKFTNCGMGVIYHEGSGEMDDTTILRCVFEDSKVCALWCWGKGQTDGAVSNHVIQDTVLRRNNVLNHDPSWNGGALKYLYTKNLTIDGVISYDNNGPGFWLDWANKDFVVRNSTFFGNHAGEALANYADNSQIDAWWAGVGFFTECNPSGSFIGNTFYSNLSAGLGIMESGYDGGIVVEGNTFVNNNSGIEFRAMNNRGNEAGDASGEGKQAMLGEVRVTNNQFKDWGSGGAWHTNDYLTSITEKVPIEHGVVMDGNQYDPGQNQSFGKWLSTSVSSLDELREQLSCEEDGSKAAIEFDGPLCQTEKTPLEAVGKKSMWQVDSWEAEKNNMDEALKDAAVGDKVVLPVTGRKELVEENGQWAAEIYDLQARYVKLTLSHKQKEWVESHIPAYASTAQIDVEVVLTKKDPYQVEAVLGEIE